MYISKVRISNYRGLKGDEFEASKFTCAIGENNAGKSSILLATSLFFSGTALTKSEFYDVNEPIEIELTFSDVADGDINRLSPEHRDRIRELISDDSLVLTRVYHPESKTGELLCTRLTPKDVRFSKAVIDETLKGKKGKDVSSSIIQLLPEHEASLKNLTKIGDAKVKVQEIIEALPPEQLELKLADLPTGIDASIKALLPEPIYIAAVKDLKDDVKTAESTTFGKLLKILLKFLEGSEHFETISKSFTELHALLNVVREAELVSDNRLQKLQAIEKQIEGFLSENFPASKIEIEIPKPELKQVLSNARILIDDGVRDVIETKGDGIKRAVTFALLRTYVEQVKEQKRNVAEINDEPDAEGKANAEAVIEQPYIFLFEEPELYLHPNAQRILFEALEKLTENGNQVFATTHSPLFFSPQATGTFIKVVKQYPADNKPFGRFLTVNLLTQIDAKDAFQILCYENNAAAFFSNKVLLVEGDSDVIYLKEIARLLNPDWNFDNKNIPILSINGKSNIKRFIDFYKHFQIEVYSILDSDALIDGFEKFDVNQAIKDKRSTLLLGLDKAAEAKGAQAELPASKIKEICRKYSWKERYTRLKEIGVQIIAGTAINPEEMEELNFLFSEEENNLRREFFLDDAVLPTEKCELLADLRSLNIFILSRGAIEAYYPPGIIGVDKPTRALNAITYLKGQADCRSHLPTIQIDGKPQCELEVILDKVFEN